MLVQIKNTFFFTLKVLTVVVACLSGIETFAQDSWEGERDRAKALITTEKLNEEIRFLTDTACQGRATGSEGSIKAARHIGKIFKKAGMTPLGDSWLRSFHISKGLRGQNVIGMLPGSKSIPCDRYIIVGAHYDHLGIIGGKLYPGADANASGVAAMTSLAEMFGEMRRMGRILKYNIIFVAFDAKEHGFKGSEAFWNLIEYERLVNPLTGQRITKDKICLMVNIDQIGSTLAPLTKGREDYIIMLGSHSLKPASRRDVLASCNTRRDIGLELSLDYYGSENFTRMFYRLSDQKVFVDNKVPAVFFTSGITMNTNKTWDTAESLDMTVLQKRIYLMFHWIDIMVQIS